jgi:effector-binding domain-containing protein
MAKGKEQQRELTVTKVIKMKFRIRIAVAVLIILGGALKTMAIEEASYKVLKSSGKFEIREYTPHILAETVVDGDLEEAGNKAFRRLFNYISGENRSRAKVAMTAPVSQEKAGEKISMTAPVVQQRARDKWAVSFTMPASYTLETLPTPDDPQITLRLVPARRMAAVRYSGLWSEKNYLQNRSELETWIREQGLTAAGDPVWARYNPPFTPWFLRRNEILIPLAADVH